ncbi:maintenance of mitochondrial structure and function-domain-containing protein [Chlamydoabsidia padenii]|nr:maintenance of mitochondrial structure and function-domain-containing protein [Chlamydoabsidia padenii]
MTSMDTSDDNSTPIVSTQESNSGLSISIHPLVLLNISDHHTRTRLQIQSDEVNICGALLAQQSGRDIDIINSFEVPLDETTIDQNYLITKLDQLKQVFPNLDFIGWYSTGTTPTERDLKIHGQFLEKCESSLFLQLDPRAITNETSQKSLPVGMYESIYDLSHQEIPRVQFVKNHYKIETNEAERIAVDHVAKPDMSSHESSLGSSLGSYLTTQKNAALMLHTRLQFLQTYLQDTKNGVIPVDHDILRQISSLCLRSPVTDQAAFDDQFTREYDDVLLVGYLASITKGINTVDDLVDKFNLTYGAINLPKASQVAGPSSHRKGRRSHAA